MLFWIGIAFSAGTILSHYEYSAVVANKPLGGGLRPPW